MRVFQGQAGLLDCFRLFMALSCDELNLMLRLMKDLKSTLGSNVIHVVFGNTNFG